MPAGLQLTQALRSLLLQSGLAPASSGQAAVAAAAVVASQLRSSSSLLASCSSPSRTQTPSPRDHRTRWQQGTSALPMGRAAATAPIPLAYAAFRGDRSFWGAASSSSGSADAPDPAALQDAEKMLNLMASSPQMQQMMMRMLPPSAQNPETIQLLLRDPGMKEKLVHMLAKQKLRIPSHILDKMTSGHMEQTFERAAKMGVNPQDLFSKLMGQPALLAKLQQPRIMSVFMDVTANPGNMSKYQDDHETMEVIREVRAALNAAGPPAASSPAAALQPAPEPAPPVISLSAPDAPASASDPAPGSAVPPPPGTPPAPGSPPAPDATAGALRNLAALGGSPDLLSIMMSDPELMRRMQNPKVQAALMEISKSPWKTIKYVMDREVMEVFSALNNVMRGKDPWTGKKRGAAAGK